MPRVPLILLALTVGYLAIEVAFTSYLIEFLGSAPSQDEIHRVERVGRTLTGLALALFIFPLILGRLRRLPRWGTAGVIAAVTLGSIGLAQLAIEQLVVRTTERTSAEERRVALIATAGVNRIHAQDDGAPVLLVNDSFLPDVLRGTIEGRVILAALPFLLANTQAVERRLVDVLTKAAEERIRIGYGTPEKIFNQAYVPLVGEYVGGLYDAYVTAANQARTAMRDRIERSDASGMAMCGAWRRTGSCLTRSPRHRGTARGSRRRSARASRSLRKAGYRSRKRIWIACSRTRSARSTAPGSTGSVCHAARCLSWTTSTRP